MDQVFFPARSIKLQVAGGVLVATWGVILLVLDVVGGGTWRTIVVGPLFVLSGLLQVRNASRQGIVVSDSGITCRSGWLGANGTWSWSEIDRFEAYLDPAIKNPPEELVAVTTSGDLIRLGRLDRRGELVALLRAHVPLAGRLA